jgi:adenylyl-sulfate kinase
MQNAKPDAADRTAGLRICLLDTVGRPAALSQLRALCSHIDLTEGGIETHPDVAIVVVDASDALSVNARRLAAMAAIGGARHIALAVVGGAPDAAALTRLSAALADFAGKLDFESAVATAIDEASAAAGLRTHLLELAANRKQHADAGESAAPSAQFAAHIACLSPNALLPGREYSLRLAGQKTTASLMTVKYRLDFDTLRRIPARTISSGEIGACTIATEEPLVLAANGEATRFTLCDLFTDEVIAVGTVDFALRRGLNVHWQPFAVSKEQRAAANHQRPCIIWFTGLSGAGKSTIANLVEGWLALSGKHTYLLDGDNVRHGLNKDLGFTAADRVENIRRVGEVARLFVDSGLIVLCSFISPFRAEREFVRSLVQPNEFIEVHVTAPLAVCEERDPKGLYAKCRAGHLPNFTGIDSPYEEPQDPDIVLDTSTASAAELAHRVVDLLHQRGIVSASEDLHARATVGL